MQYLEKYCDLSHNDAVFCVLYEIACREDLVL